MAADCRRWRTSVSFAILALPLMFNSSALAKPASLCVNPGGTGGCFSKIQDAVNTAKSGSIITVAFGSYFENIVVPKIKLTINADPDTAVFGNTTAPIFQVPAGATVTVSGIQFQDTFTASACIESSGNLTMKNAGVFLCLGVRGAGIHQVGGKLTMIGSSLDANEATENGGCLAMEGGTLTLNNTDVINCIAHGDGGGIWLSNTKTNIIGVGGEAHEPTLNIANDKAAGSGGGIFASGGKLTIEAAIFVSNSAAGGDGGGIKSMSPLTIADSVFRDNVSADDGGGVLALGSGMLKVTNSSFIDNRSKSDGGGIAAETTFNLLNDTLFGNRSDQNGGAILAQGNGKIGSLTIDGNASTVADGGGIHIASGSVTITNTIIARNAAPMAFAQDCGGSFVSQGFNLIFDTTGCTINGQTATNITGQDPNLGAPAPFDVKIVQKPDTGSPVLGMGGHCPKSDELLHTRPKSHCDIGAFESP